MSVNQPLRLFFLRFIILVFTISAVVVSPLNAAKDKASFRLQNDVIYTGECAGGSSSGASGSSVTGSENGWVFPVKKETPISSDYKAANRPGHKGVDLAGPMGDPIYASRDGTVVNSGAASGFGNWIVIQHNVDGKRVDSVYGHMQASDLLVKKGDKVKAGQHISNIGNEGESSGAHLHYEEWDNGRDSGSERKPEAVYGKSGTATSTSAPSGTSTASAACCGSSGANKTAATAGGGGCGEQGYAEGKRNSEANKQQIWGFLKSKGLSDIAAAGVLGNMDQESGGFMPDAENWLDPPCIGIIQWCFERRDNLITYAKEKVTEWSCLGTQLEFMWHEVTETAEGAVMVNLKAAKTPSEAANIWAREYERPGASEYAGRAEKAEKHYTDMTGKSGAAQLSSSGSVASCASAADSGAGIMSADCKTLVEKYKQLRTSGKLKETDAKSIDQDLANCTEDPIVCGISGGEGGGVHPVLLRAVIAGIENSGGGEFEVWNMNTRHPCDQFNHPPGKASDIVCNGNSSNSKNDATPKCNAIFKYYHDNYDELKLSELIWQYPPPPFSCDDGKSQCDVEGHKDHIHIGVTP